MQASPFLGELVGTLVLILLGNGVVANVLLKGSKAENAGWIVITAGWAFAVTFGIFVAQAFGSSAAHLNPAVTMAFAVLDNDFSQVVPFISAQLIGAFLGATLVWVYFRPHWAQTPDPSAKLGCFATSPAIRSPKDNFTSEFLGTLVLIVGVFAIGKTANVPAGVGPYLVGFLVWSIGLSLGGTTGYAINPARDLGPRLAHALLPIAGKGDSGWSYAWVPIAGPIAGAMVTALWLSMF